MTYMFRVRFKVGPTTRIDAKVDELVLDETGPTRVFLRAVSDGQTVNEADELVIRGRGYATESQAADEGKHWTDALVLGMISEFVGIEFGERGPTGMFSEAGLALLRAANPGVGVYNDIAGLQVVSESPRPVFVRTQATALAGKNGAVIAAHVREAFRHHAEPDERSLLACEMYASSHFMPSEDSRFLMLMVAVEALIEAGTRSPAQLEAIDGFVEQLGFLPLSKDERESLKPTIHGLKRESINSAGKRLAATLGDRKYAGKLPTRFFQDCYAARSNLVHGNQRRPSFETILGLIGPLEHFVRDLVLTRNGLLA